jgi:hypothetical protein
MGDIGDVFNALRSERQELRSKFGIECLRCKVVRPKTNASILLPGQRCKVDGYRDPRARRALNKDSTDE